MALLSKRHLALLAVLSAVLQAATAQRSLLQAPAAAPAAPLVDVLTADTNLGTLRAAIATAVPALATTTVPVTIFAPNNTAFAKALRTGSLTCITGGGATYKPCTTAAELLASESLAPLLLDHTVKGIFPLSSLANGTLLYTWGESIIKITSAANGTVYANNATITATNIPFAGGIIHMLADVITTDGALTTPALPGVAPASVNTTAVALAEKLTDAPTFADLLTGNTTRRALVVTDLAALVPAFRINRQLIGQFPDGGLANPMALSLDPTLGNQELRALQGSLGAAWEATIPEGIKRPADNESLAFMSVLELASLLRSKQVTSMELTKLYLDRMKRYDYVLEAVVTYTEELAMQQATAADALIAAGTYLSPLHGIPFALKDLIAVKGYRTTWGTDAYVNQTLPFDATGYTRLRNAGAVLIAKVSTGAMASGNIWWGGATKCPWNITDSASGSSAGPGASMASATAAFTLGTETGGSIIGPSNKNGITGMRPSANTIPRTHIMSLGQSLDHLGPMARSAADAAVIYDVLRGEDGLDIDVRDVALEDPFKIDIKQLRIGMLGQGPTGGPDGFNDGNITNVARVLESLGAEVTDIVSLNYTIPGGRNLLLITMYAETLAHFDQWQRSGLDLTNRQQSSWPRSLAAARFISAVDYIQAQRARFAFCSQAAALMDGFDVIIAPGGFDQTLGNLCGIPQIAFPAGTFTPFETAPTSPRRRPQMASVIGPVFSDSKLLAVVMAFQSVTKYHYQRPPIDAVEAGVVKNATTSAWSRLTLPPGSWQAAAVQIPKGYPTAADSISSASI